MFSDFQREKEILMRENDGLKLKLDQSEKDRLFFFEQIDDLKRNLKIKNEELYGLEQQKFIEIERIRLEYEETQNKDIVIFFGFFYLFFLAIIN